MTRSDPVVARKRWRQPFYTQRKTDANGPVGDTVTDFLCRVGQRLRRGRSRFSPPESSFYMKGRTHAAIWYPTRGCRWDFAGYCTMCNYGFPERVSHEQVLRAVQIALEAIPAGTRTIWVSPYNTLDETEVPRQVRQAIFSMLGETDAELVVCESHPTTVRTDLLADCLERLNGKKLCIQIGIESMNEFVRTCSINKGLSKEQIVQAVTEAHRAGAYCTANLLLGAPFLSPREALADTIASIRAADEIGIDWFTVFPNHAKPHTIVWWLAERNEYQPPSLWGLVDVLEEIGPVLSERVFLAWLTPQEHPGACEGVPPAGGSVGVTNLSDTLMAYADHRDYSILRALFSRSDADRLIWREQTSQPNESAINAMARLFPRLSDDILGNLWWQDRGAAVLADVQALWNTSGHAVA